MLWPPHSPDMNIIEHVWATLKCHVNMQNPQLKNLDELWEMVEWEWYHISDEEIAHLYDSIPCHIAVIKANGWYTEYWDNVLYNSCRIQLHVRNFVHGLLYSLTPSKVEEF